ncbi:RNA-binding protein NOB1 [Protopterus annectens]|uniref:RNA-binding protein NOB1 n=1 Tax=Protopterus annectens TaxID=7888 RepID=UPI001CFA1231|nr:RNA-binding protein NOB1 [Protopterus annectens]
MAQTMVEHVICDAGAFLMNAALQDIGKNVYTLKEVVGEIRDKETKRRLAVLPYLLHFKEPFPEYIKQVTEFSKKTGDYPSLSATDIKVLALTCQLHAEYVGQQSIKKDPDVKVEVRSTLQHPEAPVHIAGFHLPSKGNKGPSKVKESDPSESENANHLSEDANFNTFQFWRTPLPSIEADLQELLGATEIACRIADFSLAAERSKEDSADSSGPEEKATDTSSDGGDDEDDDDEGWITPSNIKQIQKDMGCTEAPVNIVVGCLTTDFSMQNVLIQMGLHALSLNGMVIRQARSYVLHCHACFKNTTNMNKVFCPHCGNKTLKKVAVTVKEDGSLHMHFSRNPKVLNPRGLKYSLPIPKGGKHTNNPHLVDDQNFPQQRLSKKARQKTNVFDPDYIAGVSPFVENDIYSRAANLQIRDNSCGAGRRRMNPNIVPKKFVKR